jgi:long-chain acyl-CoA synthetase
MARDSTATPRAERPLARLLREMLTLEPDSTAIFFEDLELPWSYYDDAITALGTLLSAYPTANRIGIVLRNRPGCMAAIIATLATGREIITLSPHLGDAGLATDIVELAPDVVVAEADDWARRELSAAAATIAAIAVRSGTGPGLAAQPVDWVANPAGRPAEDVAVLMMTSGTTGRPKRIELSYAQMVAAFRTAGRVAGGNANPPRLRPGTAILWASLVHIGGLYFAVAHVLEGRRVALLERFEPHAWADLVTRYRPQAVRLAPAAIRMVLDADVPPATFDSVREVGSGTAPLPLALADEFEARYGVPVLAIYGATEFAGAIAAWTLKDKRAFGDAKRGSTGRAYPGIELRIVDRDTSEVLPTGEIGLLEARGSQLGSENGAWTRTTDLASIDQDGFLFIHGRADDAINRGGFKIPPDVIENALLEHPAVNEAVALAKPDPRLGEVPVAVVTILSPATEAELLDYLTGKLTRYQLPVAVRVVDTLPRTPSLKVSRPMVRELYFPD